MAMQIPLEGGAINAHQEFSVQLGENLFEFRLDWKQTIRKWAVNITIGENMVVAGALLIANTDIIDQWSLSDTLGRLVCVSMTGDNPSLDNIGTDIRLLWYAPDGQ